MTFKPIRPQKITVQIADQIRASILTAAFGPGEKLPTERELCRIFGVSRPSVREALNILAAAGLVESHQGGGTTVRSLVEASAGSPLSELIKYERERALDVIEVRKSIEACTAFYAADRALPEDVRRLEKIVSEMEENLATETPSLDLDADFHIAVARATHNVVWLHLMQNIFDAMQQFQRGSGGRSISPLTIIAPSTGSIVMFSRPFGTGSRNPPGQPCWFTWDSPSRGAVSMSAGTALTGLFLSKLRLIRKAKLPTGSDAGRGRSFISLAFKEKLTL